MAKVKQSDLDDWNIDEQRQRQRALQLELVEKLKRRQDAGETLLSQQEIDWFKGRPVTDKEMDELKEHIEMTNNTIQTKTTWTENKRWTAAVIGLLCVIGFMSVLVIYNLFWYVLVSIFGVWLLGVMLVASKDIVDDLIDEW
jgi:hypothetical protein